MKTGVNNLVSGVILVALVLAPVAPASAEGVAGRELELDIQLGELMTVDNAGFASESTEMPVRAAQVEPILIAEAAVLPVRDPRRLAQVSQLQDAPAQQAPKKGGTGRWLKKHWWVPVLVGVAVGVVLLEPFDDDDDERPAAMMPAV